MQPILYLVYIHAHAYQITVPMQSLKQTPRFVRHFLFFGLRTSSAGHY
jgi:hypothetical protein